MANEIFGQAKVPGLSNYTRFGYTCVHGITPGVITLVVPDEGFEELRFPGKIDIEVTDGIRRFTLRECLATEAVRQPEQDGYGYRVTLLDRRWKWQDTAISGVYNQRDDLNKIREETRKTVHELATLCLKAMRVNRFFLGSLPNPDVNEALPSIQWDNQNAAQALADLCDQFKCRVVYQPVQDRVLLTVAGTGVPLPGELYTEDSPSFEVPRKPEILRFVGAPMAFTMTLVLEAVGLDLDGKVKPIDELSYKPAGGWQFTDRAFTQNLVLAAKFAVKGKVMSDCTAAAQKSVYRWYRISLWPAEGNIFEVPGLSAFLASDGKFADVYDTEQIICLDRVIGHERAVEPGNEERLFIHPAAVYGAHANAFTGGTTNFEGDTQVRVGFSIDPDRGLVIFNSPVAKYNSGAADLVSAFIPRAFIPANGFGPADLILLTSVFIRDQFTRAPMRFTLDRRIPGGERGTVRVVRNDSVQFARWNVFKREDWKFKRSEDNLKECTDAANHYLDAAEVDFQRRVGGHRVYPRLLTVDPDGAITEVAWQIGGGCFTTISRNSERAPWIPPFIFRRRDEKVKGAVGLGLLGGGADLANALLNANNPLE